MAFIPIDEEEIIDEPVAEEAKRRFIPIKDDEFFGIGGEEKAPEPVTVPKVVEPTEAPKSRFTPIAEEEFFGLPEPTEPIPVTGEEGFLRQAADVPLKIGESINTSLRALTDLFGADNAVSQNLTQNAEWYRSLLSAQALEDEQEVGRILQEAENEGILDQLGAGLEAFSVAPIDFVASGIGSLATFAATGLAGRAAAAAGVARAGLTGAAATKAIETGVRATQLATGAGMGAGIVKGEIYQSVKDEILAQGKTEEEAKSIAMEAQSYMGKNLDQILIGAGLGTLDAFTGAEKIIGKVLTKGGLKPDASRIGNIIKNGITEAAPEFIQAAQEKFASNLALQREGVDVSLTQGVFSQGALEGLVGLGLGVGAGAIEPRIQTEPTKEEVSAAAAETQDVARRSMDVAPATASLVEGEAEQIIQSQAETPDQRLARLQQEAQAGAEITLEEETAIAQENAPQAQARITEREGQIAQPVETPAGTRVEAAAYQAPDGTIYFGADHLEAMAKARDAGKIEQAEIDAKQETTSRETPEFGFATNAESFVSRDQAEQIGKASGQVTVEQPATGKLHSNEVVLDAFPSGLPAQPVTPTPEAPPVAPVAPAEPVVPAGGVQPPVTPEVAPTVSRITPQQDQEYLDAVEKGDLDSAKRSLETAISDSGLPTVYLADVKNPAGGWKTFPATFIRVGLPPTEGPSGVYRGAERIGEEAGVSVYAAWKDPKTGKYVIRSGGISEAEAAGRQAYEVSGPQLTEVGSDEEALLETGKVSVVREIPLSDIVTDDTPYLAFDGTELTEDETPNWSDAPDLLDSVVVRDDAGNVIPPSQRFQQPAPEAPVTPTLTEVAPTPTAEPPTLAPTEPAATTTVPPTVEAAPEARGIEGLPTQERGVIIDAAGAPIETILQRELQDYQNRVDSLVSQIPTLDYGTTTEQRTASLDSLRTGIVNQRRDLLTKEGFVVRFVGKDETLPNGERIGSNVVASPDGRVTITFGNSEVFKIAQLAEDGAGAKQLLANAINEEIIHAIHIKHILSGWDKTGSVDTFLLQEVGKRFNTALQELGRDRFVSAFGAMMRGYYRKDMTDAEMIRAITATPLNTYNGYLESVRQLVEMRDRGEIGETTFQRVVSQINQFFRDIAASIKSFVGSAEYQNSSLKKEVDAVASAFEQFIPAEPSPKFADESPEAKTLSTMRATMEKVDAASEAKGGKPETQKISEIAANWMEQGGDTRALQDAITENTNLSPANAQKVANAIARQYDIQQSIATAFLETPAGISVEAIPEGATLPKEVDPDRLKPVMQRLFEVFMGVRVPPVKITGNEKAFLKQQIRLKAAANRAAKDAQKATATDVVETIKQMELRGPVRPKQALALAKRAARVIWTSEKSVEVFTEYAAKVVENTNYDADVREAKTAQKRAKELSKQKTVAMSPQRQVLEDIGKIAIGSIEDPRLFADTINYYLRAFKRVTSSDYVVIPDSEMTSYLSQLENQEIDTNAERERLSNEALAAQYGLPVSQVEALLNSQDIIRDLVAYAKREEIESILNQKIGDIQTALKAYDQSQLRPDQRKLVDALLSIDAKGLDAKEKQTLVRIGNNVIYNNQTNGAQYFVAVANGQQNARQASQDSKTIEKNRAWIDLLPTLGSKKVSEAMRNWSLELQSVADTFRNIFGKEGMAKMFRQMGMYNLDRGFTDAANVLDQIQEKMAEFYKKNGQKYKKAARDQNGILSEGVVGFLIQGVPAKGEQESIAQRRDLIKQDIANRRSSQQKDKVDMANRIEEILNKVDGNTVEEILANMKASYRPNYDSLTYLMNDLLPQYKDFLKQFDENFNDQANNYDNPYYLPIAFVRSGPELEITPESESMFYEGMSLRPKQAANTIKRVDYTKLPTDKSGNPKEIQFNLRRGTYDSLSDQINKAYTNEAWQQIFSFMKTADADAVFGGRANKDFMAERLNRLRISRMRRGSANNGAIAKFADSVSVLARKIGTGIALGGVFQVFKQSPDQLISALGTTGRYDLLGEHVMTIGSAKKLLDKFSIGRRGDASSGYKYINQMEGAQNRLERAFTESRWSEVKENASKIADVWMVALKKTDFLCAAGAWMTYYRAQLDKNNIKFEGWDKEAELVDTDTARQDAASYAEQMTDIYQGSSDPTKMATFAQSGKSGWENFVKAALVPFNSFAIQQRMRIYSDGRDSFTKAGDTGMAGRFGLTSTIGGLIAFHTMRRLVLPTITGAGVYALYAMLGVDMDEPDEEKQKEEARKTWRQFQGELLANTLVGGAPQFVEAATIDAFNYANYLVSLQLESEDIIDDKGEIMDFAKYQKERSPFWRYQSFKNAPSFGMFDVGLGQIEKVALQTKQLTDREQMEMYTPEEQRLLFFSTLSEWLYLMRLNDADFARMVGKARRDMIKAVEDREKSISAIRNR